MGKLVPAVVVVGWVEQVAVVVAYYFLYYVSV